MKVHFAASDSPLVAGADIKSACGDTIPKAAFAYMQDGEIVNTLPHGIDGLDAIPTGRSFICLKCFSKLERRRYLYALIPGEESLHTEGA